MAFDLSGDFSGTFPFEAHYQQLGDVRLHYVDEGPDDAPPLLMLHGNPTWSYMYRRPIALLAERGHRCIAFDHMGFGRSDKPPELRRYVFSNHVDNAVALIERLDLQDVTLVMHDWGGPIGLGAALRQPERFRALVAMNTWAWELPSFLPGFLRQFRTDGLGEILALAGNMSVESIPGGMARRDTDPVMMDAYRAPFPDYWSRLGTLAFIRDVPLTENDPSAELIGQIHEALPGLDLPLRLIWGMRDRVFVPAFIEQWQALFPGTEAVELEAGHYLVEDEPDQVAGAIDSFVASL
jgi:haloalkane dehalogenase